MFCSASYLGIFLGVLHKFSLAVAFQESVLNTGTVQMIDLHRVSNPKIPSGAHRTRADWFPYYAGFSWDFASDIITALAINDASVLDPWNGSGTTTAATAAQSKRAHGVDINPAMVLVASARLLNKRSGASLVPLAQAIAAAAKKSAPWPSDPLLAWFFPSSVAQIRSFQLSLHQLLSSHIPLVGEKIDVTQSGMSDLAASLYLALFRTLRGFALPLRSSNPTWTKVPAPKNRIRITHANLKDSFIKHAVEMTTTLRNDPVEKDGPVSLCVGSSESLPFATESIDLVLSSPPYCTRIDYASATHIELALLGYGGKDEFTHLRREMIGTTTVPITAPPESDSWGPTCSHFLNQVKGHTSKASATYYYKNHCQYFASVAQSINEVHRCMRGNAKAVLVAQDSYYKSIHNDLPLILTEMAAASGLALKARRDFPSTRNMARVNPLSEAHRTGASAKESVLVFQKTS